MAAMARHPRMGPRNTLTNRRFNLRVFGRLRPDVTVDAARAALETEAQRWELAYPEADETELLIRTASQSRFWVDIRDHLSRERLAATVAMLLGAMVVVLVVHTGCTGSGPGVE